MALTLNETRVNDDAKFTEMLDDLQANILKHHGRDYAYHLFLSVKPNKHAEARKWIADFATSKITSAAKQLIDSKNKNEKRIDGGTVFTLSITEKGYRNLEVADSFKPNDPAYMAGMKQRNSILADDTTKWETGFTADIDVLIIVANDIKAIAFEQKDNLLRALAGIFEIQKEQKGEILKNSNNIGIEHFGYADGISQPIFLESEILKQQGHSIWKDEATLDLILVKDKGGKFNDSYGSYLVFRKLEQNVKAFKASEKLLPEIKESNGTGNEELAGAMIVGRFEDGTEIINESRDRGITRPDELNNDFNYASDPTGSKCPFHAHVRLTNPRTDVGEDFAKSVRIVRRGIPYDDIPGGRQSLDVFPTGDIGLLFLCYQSSIENQFEFIQSTWANQGLIRHPDGKIIKVGQDGIIGQGHTTFRKELPEQWGVNGQKKPCNFSNPDSGFVTTKGGEYFFTPSISFLKSLSN